MNTPALEKLKSADQRVWLLQHIPHRICASLTWLKELEGTWVMPPDPEWKDKDRDKFHIYCVGRSVDEGRKAAMRWLIEFVGVADIDPKTKLPREPRIFCEHENVSIKRFNHSEPFVLTHTNVLILSSAWKGCTQASVHPTTDTNHPVVDPPNLAAALSIIIECLEKNLYAPNGLTLLEVVRDQEERKRFKLL